MKSKILNILSLILIVTAGIGFTISKLQDPWPVPEKYNKMVNPVKTDAASIDVGKVLWVKHCQSCHGKSGKGDGSKAAQLDTSPGDLTKASFHSQSDGAIFYKTWEGRDDMPNFKKKIPDQEDVWSLVNYMRTFKK